MSIGLLLVGWIYYPLALDQRGRTTRHSGIDATTTATVLAIVRVRLFKGPPLLKNEPEPVYCDIVLKARMGVHFSLSSRAIQPPLPATFAAMQYVQQGELLIGLTA